MKQQQKCTEYQYFAIVLLFTCSLLLGNCDGFLEEIGFFHLKRKKLEKIWKKFENGWIGKTTVKMGRIQTLFSCIFSCDQAALWMVQSVRPSVCLSVRLSVRHTFLTMFLSTYHHEIFRSYYQWQKWRPCKKSRSEVKGQGHRGHDPT